MKRECVIRSSFKSLRTLDGWRAFFMGRAYPILVAALVLFGNLTALDYYVNFAVTLLFAFAMVVCDSIRPAIITVCTYIYQISIPHAPSYPTYSDFIFSGWRKPVSVCILIFIAFFFIFFFVKKRIYSKMSIKKTPLLLPLTVFSLVMLLNGAFSSDWTYKNLIFAFLNILVYFFLYFIILYGFSEKETYREIVDYFVYISLLMALIIICEMSHLYLTSDKIFVDGAIDKERVALGWGIWNLMGNSISVLIPTLFIGAAYARRSLSFWLYFGAATLSWVFAVLTMSRNALVFSTLIYAASILLLCFVGQRKKIFRIIAALGMLACALFVVVFFGKIKMLLGDYFERGFSDNGRYALWTLAIDTFKGSFVFGNGFYGFFTTEVFEFGAVPRMAHNTVFEILAAMGTVGMLGYLYYRFKAVMLFVRRPSISKTLLGFSVLVFLLGSLLDNFVFNIHPALYYTVIMAIVARAEMNGSSFDDLE